MSRAHETTQFQLLSCTIHLALADGQPPPQRQAMGSLSRERAITASALSVGHRQTRATKEKKKTHTAAIHNSCTHSKRRFRYDFRSLGVGPKTLISNAIIITQILRTHATLSRIMHPHTTYITCFQRMHVCLHMALARVRAR